MKTISYFGKDFKEVVFFVLAFIFACLVCMQGEKSLLLFVLALIFGLVVFIKLPYAYLKINSRLVCAGWGFICAGVFYYVATLMNYAPYFNPEIRFFSTFGLILAGLAVTIIYMCCSRITHIFGLTDVKKFVPYRSSFDDDDVIKTRWTNGSAHMIILCVATAVIGGLILVKNYDNAEIDSKPFLPVESFMQSSKNGATVCSFLYQGDVVTVYSLEYPKEAKKLDANSKVAVTLDYNGKIKKLRVE